MWLWFLFNKINDLSNETVVRVEVPVDDVHAVQVPEPRGHVARQPRPLHPRQRRIHILKFTIFTTFNRLQKRKWYLMKLHFCLLSHNNCLKSKLFSLLWESSRFPCVPI